MKPVLSNLQLVLFSTLSLSLIYLVTVIIVFLTKEKIKTRETRVYTYIIFINFISVILEVVLYVFALNLYRNNESFKDLFLFISKIFTCFICFWYYMMSLYTNIIYNKYSNKNNNENKYIINRIVFIIICVFIMLLPTSFMINNNTGYTNGPSTKFAGLAMTFECGVMLFYLLKSRNNIRNREFVPVILSVISLVIVVIVQTANPALLLSNPMITFVTIIMCFTIENPDLKIISELSEAKQKAEKYINEKEIFSFNMSQKIKDPIKDIEELCEDLSKSNDVDELKDGINSIRISSSKIKYLVNDTLTKVSPDKIDIRENEYNSNLLFKEVNYYIKNKASKYNVSFIESKYNKDAFVIGDNLKIKQVICAFSNEILKEIKSMIMTLNTNIISNDNDYILSFKFIIPKINITLEELNKNEEIDDYDKLDFDNISLSKLKKLINLLDGYIEIKNISEEQMEITINFEQKKAIVQDKSSINYINEYEKENNKPKIMLVDDNSDTKNISRYVNKHKYDLTVATSGGEALEIIRNKNKYDLILLDDDLDKLDTITVFNRLNAIDGFNIPVIYVGDVSNKQKEDYLLELGFKEVLLKPINQKEFDEILNKYVK